MCVLTSQEVQDFRGMLERFYAEQRRDMPWRYPQADGSYDPYRIMVSEIMLQQTQVVRALPKYREFLDIFPHIGSLADALQSEVLKVWSGLGYNRRARYLHQAAIAIMKDFGGQFPADTRALQTLPGIGANTAGAIVAYAFNQPVVFIETNIRTVYIHCFFGDRTDVSDKEISNLVEQTLDHDHPREFYYALMDYGSFLKRTVGNLNSKSKSYARQSAFDGSRRQIRGRVIRRLIEGPVSEAELQLAIPDRRLSEVLEELRVEGLIRRDCQKVELHD